MKTTRLVTLLALVAVSGCSALVDGSKYGSASDAGARDSGPADTGPADTGPADTGPADTGPADTGPADTGPPTGCTTDCGPGMVCDMGTGRCVSACAPGLAPAPGDGTCVNDCTGCISGETCMGGACVPTDCSALGAVIFDCDGPGDPSAPVPAGLSAAVIPALRLGAWSPSASIDTSVVAIVPHPLDAAWSVLYMEEGLVWMSTSYVHSDGLGGSCPTTQGMGDPLLDCEMNNLFAIDFDAKQLRSSAGAPLTTFLGTHDAAAGWLWQLTDSAGVACAVDAIGSAGPDLLPPLAVGRTRSTGGPNLPANFGSSAGPSAFDGVVVQGDTSDPLSIDPGSRPATLGTAAVYVLDDGSLALWPGTEGTSLIPLMMFGGGTMGSPVSAETNTKSWLVAASDDGGPGITFGSCTRGASPTCASATRLPLGPLARDPAIDAAALAEDLFVIDEEMTPDSRQLVLRRITGMASDLAPVLGSRDVGGKIEDVLSVSMEVIDDLVVTDLAWAAFVEVNRGGVRALELWAGALRVCL